MTLARECIGAMREEAHVVIAAGENPSDIVFRMMQRQALAFLRTLREKGPSAKAAELANEAMCAAVEGTGPWITVEDCFRIQLDQTIREIEEER